MTTRILKTTPARARRTMTCLALVLIVAGAVGACGGEDAPDDQAAKNGDDAQAEAATPALPGPLKGPGGAPLAEASTRPRPSSVVRRTADSASGPIEPASWDPADVLRAIATAENRAARAKVIDEDVDGIGEFAGLAELTGRSGGRRDRVLADPVISRRLGDLNTYGQVELAGYLYTIYLPGRDGRGLRESQVGFGAGSLEPNLAEAFWCAYAWPVRRGGGATYFVSQDGELVRTQTETYYGHGGVPEPGAATVSEGLGRQTGHVTHGRGQDGNDWRAAE